MRIDLHGLKVTEAQAAALQFLKASAAEQELCIVTGKGVHSQRRQSILFAAVHKILKDLHIGFQVPRTSGCFTFTLAKDSLPRIMAYKIDANRPRMLVSNPSNVEQRHWHRRKGRGIDRRKKIKKDKERQRKADERK